MRKINISGNARTRDEVIRREMRQLEGAWYDGARIERSKVRIRRLGFFDDVNIETPPVSGVNDEADVEVTVTERSTGQLLAGLDLVSGQLRGTLAGHGLEEIEVEPGTSFDPEYHEAILAQPSADHPEGTVTQVLERGYLLHGKLLRPAKVIVAS